MLHWSSRSRKELTNDYKNGQKAKRKYASNYFVARKKLISSEPQQVPKISLQSHQQQSPSTKVSKSDLKKKKHF
ncbi:hypothetical protein HanHA300_Chr08g0293701 [Helianthus annuus]|nr:hypothetical protein HanHA300_Chr08g0293701 [Helianthus annuus]KAJ0554783.1 hypothetical protein HanHA89_Chr08g0312181 [Helianthus annuus]KAJ0720351.1 hypothetical protein HanLR1_Chr08g0292531 [Helianthus annuus]